MHHIKKFFNHVLANHYILFFTIIIVFIVLIGTISFHFVEKWDIFSSFYFTTVTMATVGYGDMAPMTYGGKILAIMYGFMGAPLFIGLTGIILQSKFHKIVKGSMHEYHKEIREAQKEAEHLAEDLKKEHELQKETFKEMEEVKNPEPKQVRWKRIFKKFGRKK